jgi:hypothetical protein
MTHGKWATFGLRILGLIALTWVLSLLLVYLASFFDLPFVREAGGRIAWTPSSTPEFTSVDAASRAHG